jgi:hypothetical protein
VQKEERKSSLHLNKQIDMFWSLFELFSSSCHKDLILPSFGYPRHCFTPSLFVFPFYKLFNNFGCI